MLTSKCHDTTCSCTHIREIQSTQSHVLDATVRPSRSFTKSVGRTIHHSSFIITDSLRRGLKRWEPVHATRLQGWWQRAGKRLWEEKAEADLKNGSVGVQRKFGPIKTWLTENRSGPKCTQAARVACHPIYANVAHPKQTPKCTHAARFHCVHREQPW